MLAPSLHQTAFESALEQKRQKCNRRVLVEKNCGQLGGKLPSLSSAACGTCVEVVIHMMNLGVFFYSRLFLIGEICGLLLEKYFPAQAGLFSSFSSNWKECIWWTEHKVQFLSCLLLKPALTILSGCATLLRVDLFWDADSYLPFWFVCVVWFFF